MGADAGSKLIKHTAASVLPSIIGPAPERLTVAITALCNLRCIGCRYGRDYMPKAQLAPEVVCDLLSDAAAVGFPIVRLYGGEPLLHPQLPLFIQHAIRVGIKPAITTNGILLQKRAADLYAAGLRVITIGYYGFGENYDRYVSRNGAFSASLELCTTVPALLSARLSSLLAAVFHGRPEPRIAVYSIRWRAPGAGGAGVTRDEAGSPGSVP